MDETLVREIIDRLARIETSLDPILANQSKLNSHDIAIAKLSASVESAHKRLNETQEAVSNSAKRIETNFKTYANILWIAITFFIGVIIWILDHR